MADKKYGNLKAPKKMEEEDFESEMLMDEDMDFDDEELGADSEAPENDLSEILSGYSKEEIQQYLDSMDEDFVKPTMITGGP